MNRFVAHVALLVLLLLAGCAQSLPAVLDDDPVAVFAALEDRLNEEDHVRFSFSMNETTAAEDMQTTLDGTVQFGPNNQVRVESNGYVSGLGAMPSMVSDGAAMTGGRNGIEAMFLDFENQAVPPELRRDIIGNTLRWGVYTTLQRLVQGSPPGHNPYEAGPNEESLPGDPTAHVAIRNAAWGLPEAFNGIPVRPLSFTLIHPNDYEGHITLWLNQETGLPVRQTVRLAFDSERITEIVYSNWSSSAILSTTFSLPE